MASVVPPLHGRMAMDACCAASGEGGGGYGGHRRAQADCSLPEICPSARCAEVFLPFYESCSAELEATPELGAGLAALSASCNEVQTGSSLAYQLNLECTDASVSAEECIPPCNAEYHGYMLLLNLDGIDSKFSCNLMHGLYVLQTSIFFDHVFHSSIINAFVRAGTHGLAQLPRVGISARTSRLSSPQWCLEQLACT